MIQIRPFREGDEEGIRALFQACFHKDMSREEWEWKYCRAHLGSSSFVAEDDGRIIAHYGGFRLRFRYGETTFDAFQGCDVMTDPEYRARLFSRRGVIVRLAEAFYKANPSAFIYGFPSERHGKLMTAQLSFEPYRFVTVLKKERARLKTRSTGLVSVGKGWDGVTPIDLDGLWAQVRQHCLLTIEKDSRYLYWRYRDSSRRTYEAISLRSYFRRKIRAFAVIKEENGGLHILDFFSGGDGDVRALLAVIENEALARKLDYVSLWLNPLEKTYQAIRSTEYIEERGIPFSVRVFSESPVPAAVFVKEYCYRLGDYDAA